MFIFAFFLFFFIFFSIFILNYVYFFLYKHLKTGLINTILIVTGKADAIIYSNIIKKFLIFITILLICAIIRFLFEFYFIISILLISITRVLIKPILLDLIKVNSPEYHLLSISNVNTVPISLLFIDNNKLLCIKFLQVKLQFLGWNYNKLFFTELIFIHRLSKKSVFIY